MPVLPPVQHQLKAQLWWSVVATPISWTWFYGPRSCYSNTDEPYTTIVGHRVRMFSLNLDLPSQSPSLLSCSVREVRVGPEYGFRPRRDGRDGDGATPGSMQLQLQPDGGRGACDNATTSATASQRLEGGLSD
jgi:hypothetical protein